MKFFNEEIIKEVLEYNREFGILRLDTLYMFKEDVEASIQTRHLERLKNCRTLKHRTISSKLRWDELEQMAVEFSELTQKY